MYMIFICAYFEKLYLISIRYFQTHFFQNLIHLFIYHCSPIFRWTYKMIDQYGHIMTFPYQFTHALIVSRRERRGMYP